MFIVCNKKPVPNYRPVTENKITTDSSDYKFSKIVLIVHLHQAHQTWSLKIRSHANRLSEKDELDIKLGLMKNFVNGMAKTSCGFKYVRNKFPNVTQKSRRLHL